MLQLNKVSIGIDGSKILDDISFNLKRGDILSVVGESGVGKTTLLRAISGLIDVEGLITFDGQPVIGPDEKLVPGVEGVSVIFQDFQLMHNRTVYENIAYPLRAYSEDEQTRKAEELLRILMLESHRDHFPKELSGGQKQRVAIARAIANEPILLLLDEPFSNMNVALKEVIKGRVFAYLKEEEISAILVTHDPKDALAISDNVAVLESGKIIQLGSPREIYQNPKSPYVMSCFGHSNFWLQEDFAKDLGKDERLSNHKMVGVRVEDLQVTNDSEESLYVKTDQSTYQGNSYLIRAELKSKNKIYFQHHSEIGKDEMVYLNFKNGSAIKYFD